MPRQKTGYNKTSLKNLPQYKDLDDEELDIVISEHLAELDVETFENLIANRIKSFENDYDLSDMKINDLFTLRALAQAVIALDELELLIFTERKKTSLNNITIIEKLGRASSDLRSDISKLQNDLNITRKTRKGDREDSIQAYIEKLKGQAKEFYEQKMSYIFCDKCNMLLATIWFLYPEENNTITLTCHRELDSGEICNNITKVTSKSLIEVGTNKAGIMPEAIR